MSENETIFEKIISRKIPAEILMETEEAVVIRDINPQAPVHVLIIPKQKIDHISSITDQNSQLISKLMLTVVKFAKMSSISSYRLVINNGILAGESVPHLHIHLLSGREMKWPPG